MLEFAHGESETYIENIKEIKQQKSDTRLLKVEIKRDKLRFKKTQNGALKQ